LHTQGVKKTQFFCIFLVPFLVSYFGPIFGTTFLISLVAPILFAAAAPKNGPLYGPVFGAAKYFFRAAFIKIVCFFRNFEHPVLVFRQRNPDINEVNIFHK
jgi:hypothetical protein